MDTIPSNKYVGESVDSLKSGDIISTFYTSSTHGIDLFYAVFVESYGEHFKAELFNGMGKSSKGFFEDVCVEDIVLLNYHDPSLENTVQNIIKESLYYKEHMNTEIKKLLYKQKPTAHFMYVRKGHAYYYADLEDRKVHFKVPVSDMGDADFGIEMESQHLNRWINTE